MIERGEIYVAGLICSVGRTGVVTQGIEDDEIAIVGANFNAVVVIGVGD